MRLQQQLYIEEVNDQRKTKRQNRKIENAETKKYQKKILYKEKGKRIKGK